VRALALRLEPGDDLRLALEAATREHALGAACVATCVGSLTRAALRLAGASASTTLSGPLEIVALVGTLSPDGPHLHLAVADAAGRVYGGHLLPGSIVHTTAELVLLALDDVAFARVLDPRTGWKELVLRPGGP